MCVPMSMSSPAPNYLALHPSSPHPQSTADPGGTDTSSLQMHIPSLPLPPLNRWTSPPGSQLSGIPSPAWMSLIALLLFDSLLPITDRAGGEETVPPCHAASQGWLAYLAVLGSLEVPGEPMGPAGRCARAPPRC